MTFVLSFGEKKIRCLNGSTFIKAEDLIILAQMVITEQIPLPCHLHGNGLLACPC